MTDKVIGSPQNGLPERERRDYYRLHNKVLIEYRIATETEVDRFISNEENIKADEIDVTYLLDKISRQLTPVLLNIRQESPAVAQFLELLNQKIDLIASMQAFDRMSNDTNKNKNMETAITRDISEGGLSFTSAHDFDLGDLIYCRLAIIGYRLGMETFGKIVRCEPNKNENSYCIGVELPYLKELDRKNLTRFIFDKQREQLHKQSSD